MRKFICLFATVVLMILCTMTVFAATWKFDEATQVWSCTDNNGDAITEQWVKSGDQWFWLDADGKMATGGLVDDGNALYCVDEKGQMIKSNWVKVNDDNFDDKWLYFGANGRAYQNGWKTIKNEKYHFTEYAMDQGFLDNTDAVVDSELDAPWLTATYFVGEDGAMKKNYWLAVEDFDSADGKNWVFFGANGKKVTDCKKTINGSTYVFGADGLMITSFLDATVSSASLSVYMDKDGKMLKKGWVFAYPNENADEQKWFYAKGNGELVKSVVKNIDGKKYAFNENGEMLTGVVYVNDDATAPLEGGNKYMYFTESATPSEQGAAVTGKQTIEYEGENWTVLFSNRGIADIDGKKIKKDYFYINSVLQADAEDDYKYLPITVDGVDYVWNCRTGKVSKKGTFTDSDNDIQYKAAEGKIAIYKKNASGKWEFVEYYNNAPV